MASSFGVKVDYRDTIRALDRIEKKQVPFAVAKSLTQLAKIGQGAVWANTQKKFDLKAKAFIKRNIKITPAKKTDFKAGKAFSAVYTDRKIINFMVGHEAGQTRTSSTGKLAIPTTGVKKRAYRKASGGVKKSWLPSTLLKGFKGSRGKRSKQKTRKKQPFIITTKTGVQMVVRRVSKKRKPLDFLYVFSKTAKIDKRWFFARTVERVVTFKSQNVFDRNLKLALATAR